MMLTAEEREIIITIADDEKSLHVFTESKRALSTRLLRVAQALGLTVQPVGEGFEFDLPLRCLSVRVPRKATASQIANLAWRQKPIPSPAAPDTLGVSDTPVPSTPVDPAIAG